MNRKQIYLWTKSALTSTLFLCSTEKQRKFWGVFFLHFDRCEHATIDRDSTNLFSYEAYYGWVFVWRDIRSCIKVGSEMELLNIWFISITSNSHFSPYHFGLFPAFFHHCPCVYCYNGQTNIKKRSCVHELCTLLDFKLCNSQYSLKCRQWKIITAEGNLLTEDNLPFIM